ncbi:DEAD/DEAH box helicase domain containing protein [Acanthamoeba castellanii str. Neff]|uniref:RNA helicase n=1 Tax=Acanthamoeba castellanii (strain ATCC 30010 / Neff) TaxID=1257118 RepID=L8GRG3_ACACF|nr:DEAD/DEAH box helicase domain containing protein [Acanthamoeba castellanii str. Neff]ELR14721.1 DEAD/DEAH box helicase domain containing protein [Acanthamoeba castellanii str. Neff]
MRHSSQHDRHGLTQAPPQRGHHTLELNPEHHSFSRVGSIDGRRDSGRALYVPPHQRRNRQQQQRGPTPRPLPLDRDNWGATNRQFHAAAGQWPDLPVEVVDADTTQPVPSPSPVASFAEGGLDPLVLRNLLRQDEPAGAADRPPTLLERHAMPIVRAGHDLLVIAPTHESTTLVAFLAPLISALHHRGGRPATTHQQLQAVIVAPWVGLAQQILDEVRRLTLGGPLRSCLLGCGGAGDVDDVDVLVSLPEKLADSVHRRHVSLDSLRFVVLYELDRLLEADLGRQLDYIITAGGAGADGDENVENVTSQTLLFSATLPAGVKRFASQELRDSRRLTLVVGRYRPSPQAAVTQTLLRVDDERGKPEALVQLLLRKNAENAENDGSATSGTRTKRLTAIFVQTKRGVDQLAAFLARQPELAALGMAVVAIHGDTPSASASAAPVLVATAVSVRGTIGPDDARQLHVVEYDMPTHIDEYVYHVGYARLGASGGTTTVFVSPRRDAGVLPDLVELLRENQQEVPEWLPAVATNQTLLRVDDESDKPQAVMSLLREHHRGYTSENNHCPNSTGDGVKRLTAIFIRSKRAVDQFAAYLAGQPGTPGPVVVVHGDLSMHERAAAMASFLSGAAPVLVATAVTVREWMYRDDSRQLHMIEYDMPPSIDTYDMPPHVVGYAGLGVYGHTTVLVTPKRDAAVLPDLVELLREARQEVPEWLERLVDTPAK